MSPTSRIDLLAELEPVVERSLNAHLTAATDWMPHEYVPWSRGRDFDTRPWEIGQSALDRAGRAAFEVNLLTEDNLPSYHFEIATRFGRDGAWGSWVRRWTAEEGRHATAIRDYLHVSRAVDPDRLERDRMATVQHGYRSSRGDAQRSMVYVALQELATRVSHRNTGHHIDDPAGRRLLARIATDENLHMVFYRGLVMASLELDPSGTLCAIRDEVAAFEMPGTGIPDFGRRAILIARSGIYDLRRHHDDVLVPLLRHWNVTGRGGLDAAATQAVEEIVALLERIDTAARHQQERLAGRRPVPQR